MSRGRDERIPIRVLVRVPDLEVLRQALIDMADDSEFELPDLINEILASWAADRRAAALPPRRHHSRPSIRLKASA